jgi:hypothetical protein
MLTKFYKKLQWHCRRSDIKNKMYIDDGEVKWVIYIRNIVQWRVYEVQACKHIWSCEVQSKNFYESTEVYIMAT